MLLERETAATTSCGWCGDQLPLAVTRCARTLSANRVEASSELARRVFSSVRVSSLSRRTGNRFTQREVRSRPSGSARSDRAFEMVAVVRSHATAPPSPFSCTGRTSRVLWSLGARTLSLEVWVATNASARDRGKTTELVAM